MSDFDCVKDALKRKQWLDDRIANTQSHIEDLHAEIGSQERDLHAWERERDELCEEFPELTEPDQTNNSAYIAGTMYAAGYHD